MAGRQGGSTVLNVAEKNDAAKEISRVLSSGNSQRREGCSKFNKIYEFNYNIFNSNCKMIMTSVSGHLLNLEFAGVYRNWQGCPPLALFDAPIDRFCPEQFINIQKTLEREVRKCQILIIWTDCDREGENIGFEIIEVCKKVKPNITVYRARFSEITNTSINRACRNLVEPDAYANDAVEVRRELDLRIGAAFTRFQTLRLQKKFPGVLADQLISYGSCQFPTLGFVVERYKAIQEFISEPFYRLKVEHSVDSVRVEFSWERGRVFIERVCQLFLNMCLENPTASVVNVTSKPTSKWRPVALDTVEMEKLASRKLRISAKETMRIAEKLYTQGFISYPRTETNIFPKDFDLPGLVQNQTQDPNWGGFAANILNVGVNPRNGRKTDNAHPPIHPTKYANNLQGNEKRIYEFIVRHFLACLSQDAKGNKTTVEISIADEKFTASGLVILERNYLDVYPYESWNAKYLPVCQQGSTFQPDSIEMARGETTPPPLLTEADLIALMEKHGIGTDATHAEHIETIKNRKYVGEQDDRSLIPGELGMGLVEGYDSMGFEMSKPHLRSELESDLKCICEGRKRKDDVLAEQIQKYKDVFIHASQQVERLDEALSTYFGQPCQTTAGANANPEQLEISEPVRKCPKCGRFDLVLRKTREGSQMLGCQGFPTCKNGIFLPKFVLKATRLATICSQCQPGPVHKIEFEFKRGSVPPMMPLTYVSCLGGCDKVLLDLIDVREASSRPTQPDTSARSTSRPGRGRGHDAPVNPGRGSGNTNRGTRGRNRGGGGATGGLDPGNASRGQGPFRGGSGSTNPHGSDHSSVSRGGNGFGADFADNTLFGGRRGGAGSNSGPGFKSRQDPNEDSVVCDCREGALLLTVRKDGPNQGRQFFKCGSDSKCNFFLWADDRQGNTGARNAGNVSVQQNRPTTSFNVRPSTNGSSVVCDCEKEALLLTVRKDGPNQGRQFYKCGNDSKCNFFLWADDGQGNGGASNAGGVPLQQNRPTPSFNTGSGAGDQIKCNCNTDAVSRTVSKDGANKGRPFYSCAKPIGQSCGFFQWGDEDGPSAQSTASTGRGGFGGRGNSRGGRGRGAWGSAGGGGGGPKKRRCGACGEEGHTKKTCRYG